MAFGMFRRQAHVALPTQQRRLRHLQSVTVRNLQAVGFNSSLLSCYFTLHCPSDVETALYTSEVVHSSRNASWRPFDRNLFDSWQRSVRCIIVRVWLVHEDVRRLIVEWHVDLGALVYVGDFLFSGRSCYLPNAILFGMFEGYYTAPREDKLSQKVLAASLEAPSLHYPSSSVKKSYEKRSFAKFHMLQKKLAKSQYNVHCSRDLVVERLRLLEERDQLRKKCERLQIRTALLSEELDRQQECLRTESVRLSVSQSDIQAREEKLVASNEELAQAAQDMTCRKTDLSERQILLKDYTVRLFCRRCEMLGALQHVFPIVGELKDDLEIVGISLPNAEEFAGRKNQNLAVAFGHVAHVVVLISRIMQLPLRHEVIFYGSASVIFDDITETGVVVTKRCCNLYPQQRADRDDFFKYAVYLLNKSVVQIRHHMRMSTPDGRYTLVNIKDFLERMFQQRFRQLEEHSPSPLLTAIKHHPRDSIEPHTSCDHSCHCQRCDLSRTRNVADSRLQLNQEQLSQKEQLFLERRRLEVETVPQAFALLEGRVRCCVCKQHAAGNSASRHGDELGHLNAVASSVESQDDVWSENRTAFRRPIT